MVAVGCAPKERIREGGGGVASGLEREAVQYSFPSLIRACIVYVLGGGSLTIYKEG